MEIYTLPVDLEKIKKFIDGLPFVLTDGQKQVWQEIKEDLNASGIWDHLEIYTLIPAGTGLHYEYKIESSNIVPLFVKIHNLRLDYKKVSFTHVPRERNKDADKLVNMELDKRVGADSLFNL